MRYVSEAEFSHQLHLHLYGQRGRFAGVTGPGRSGAVAAVYASHYLKIPFLPYGMDVPPALRPLLVIDTAAKTGATLRRASKRTMASASIALFDEPPRLVFWYEVQPTTTPTPEGGAE